MRFTVTRTIAAQHRLSRALKRRGKSIAIVPTMGFLHEGHLTLIDNALKKADVVVTTIFVNPAQFGPREDIDQYPRDISSDLLKVRARGGQIVFVPTAPIMYPKGYETYVTVEHLTRTLEGAARPTHFRGVTTVVAKLFNIVQPDCALFGMKDYQQAVVLRKMTHDLNYPIQIIVRPTVREKDGLAMSSRNSYLTAEERLQAPALYHALKHARSLVRDGMTQTSTIRLRMKKLIGREAPLANVEYIAFTHLDDLREIRAVEKRTVVSLAARFKSARLIDNMRIA